MSVFTMPAGALVLSGTYQPNTTNVTLAIVLIVTVIYIAIVVAEMILVSRARRRRNRWRENKQQALDRLVNARSRLTELSIALGNGRHGEPYKSLHDRAQQLIENGFGAIDRLLQRIEQNALQDIPDQSVLKALLLFPLAAEIRQRQRQQREMDAIVDEVGPATEGVAQVEALRDEIATLGQREKMFAAQLRQKALELTASIEAETRPALLLEDQRRLMAHASQSLDTIEHLLQAEQPDETQVVAAFPLRAYVENDLETVANNVKQIVAAREAAEAHVRNAGNHLAALQQDIDSDVAAGCRRHRLAEQARAFAEQLDALKLALAEGRYVELSTEAADLIAGLQAGQETIRRLRAARERVAATRDGAALQLEDMRAVIRDTPPQFDRDITRKLAQQVEEAIASLEALLPSEDLDAMASVQTIEQQLDVWLKQAAQAQQTFESNRQTLEQQTETLNESTIDAAIAAADKAAGILRACHPNYWSGTTPDALQAAGEALKNNWRALVTDLTTVAESAFATALNQVTQVKQQQDALATLAADTEQVETRVQDDAQRARNLLDDPELLHQLEEFELVAPHSDELAPRAGEFAAMYQQLRQLAQEPMPYWADIITRATWMRDELASALNSYRQQLDRATGDLTRLKSRLEQMRGALESLSSQPVLDFEFHAQEPLQAIQEWLATCANADVRFLREAQATISSGEVVRLEAQKHISMMRQQQSAFVAGQTAIEAILSEATALVNQAGQLQKDGSPYGAAMWAPRRLAPARRALAGLTERLTQLLQSESRRAAETVLADLGRIRSDAESIVAPLTQAVNALKDNLLELRGLHDELKQLEQQARTLSAHSTGRLNNWATTQERIADLEDRWTHANSFEEARDALKAAQELAREFIAPSSPAQSQAPGDTRG